MASFIYGLILLLWFWKSTVYRAYPPAFPENGGSLATALTDIYSPGRSLFDIPLQYRCFDRFVIWNQQQIIRKKYFKASNSPLMRLWSVRRGQNAKINFSHRDFKRKYSTSVTVACKSQWTSVQIDISHQSVFWIARFSTFSPMTLQPAHFLHI